MGHQNQEYEDQSEEDWSSHDDTEPVSRESNNQDDTQDNSLVEQTDRCLYIQGSEADADIDVEQLSPAQDKRLEQNPLRKFLYRLCCCHRR